MKKPTDKAEEVSETKEERRIEDRKQ